VLREMLAQGQTGCKPLFSYAAQKRTPGTTTRSTDRPVLTAKPPLDFCDCCRLL
jgi:hypothetical protein